MGANRREKISDHFRELPPGLRYRAPEITTIGIIFSSGKGTLGLAIQSAIVIFEALPVSGNLTSESGAYAHTQNPCYAQYGTKPSLFCEPILHYLPPGFEAPESLDQKTCYDTHR
jgi:hypothetical protein